SIKKRCILLLTLGAITKQANVKASMDIAPPGRADESAMGAINRPLRLVDRVLAEDQGGPIVDLRLVDRVLAKDEDEPIVDCCLVDQCQARR
ncbi:MAG TPA: hypothetical protein VGN15_01490, partial [Ktedonobacteraceae bacterium]|nr:hypothetical protein [Ktedonobacteraceae bacterium]